MFWPSNEDTFGPIYDVNRLVEPCADLRLSLPSRRFALSSSILRRPVLLPGEGRQSSRLSRHSWRIGGRSARYLLSPPGGQQALPATPGVFSCSESTQTTNTVSTYRSPIGFDALSCACGHPEYHTRRHNRLFRLAVFLFCRSSFLPGEKGRVLANFSRSEEHTSEL